VTIGRRKTIYQNVSAWSVTTKVLCRTGLECSLKGTLSEHMSRKGSALLNTVLFGGAEDSVLCPKKPRQGACPYSVGGKGIGEEG